ncbi:MAG: hypothetical protein J4G09_14575 [Proteobacteria bacterium]|nr:hypothetical protein [Pseudomonadota bacterium]
MPEPGTPEEFYVGYRPQAPPGLARFVRLAVAGVLGLSALVALLLVFAQRPFSAASFEFGVRRTFEGWVLERPEPLLVVPRPGRSTGAAGASRYLLVAFGKHSAAGQVEGLDGRWVRLEGSLIYRDGLTMIELAEGSIERLEGRQARPPGAGEDLGGFTLVGEIVDSKCYLGVMKPGSLKPHRACATRCLSGGVPAVFVVRHGQGEASHLLLTDADGGSVNSRVLDRVAEPLRIRGRVERFGELLVLRADPETYERLG